MSTDAPTRDPLRDMLFDQEGTGPIEDGRFMVYTDSLGYQTVGVGRLVSRGFSEDEVLLMLDNDINECITDLAQFEWFRKMDPTRQMAVTSWRFNLGFHRWRLWKPTIALLARGDYAGAAVQFRTNGKYLSQIGQRRFNWIADTLEYGDDAGPDGMRRA